MGGMGTSTPRKVHEAGGSLGTGGTQFWGNREEFTEGIMEVRKRKMVSRL